MKQVFVFPGQGSQAVGMGRDLAAAFLPAREIFEEVDEALQQNLSRLMFGGPEDELTLTENAQPALMAVSMAVFRVLEKEGGLDISSAARYVAGHSLGEFSALAAARALPVAEAARLLRIRGRAMQDAVPVGIGAMAAILGLDFDEVATIAAEAMAESKTTATNDEVCSAANDNAPGQVVVSGHKAAVERAAEIAKEHGAKRIVMLPVSVPSHCPLMAPAADVLAQALDAATILMPVVPVVANVKAEAISDPEDIRAALVAQVTGVVRWRESVIWMKEQGVERLVELGTGKVLGGLTRRIDRDLTGLSISGPEDIESFLGH